MTEPRRPQTADEEIIQAEAPAVATLDSDARRLERIHDELDKGFRLLAGLGSAVTIFGSARVPEGDPQYELARSVARELSSDGMCGGFRRVDDRDMGRRNAVQQGLE